MDGACVCVCMCALVCACMCVYVPCACALCVCVYACVHVCVHATVCGQCGWRSSFTSMSTPQIDKLVLGKWLWQGQEAQQALGTDEDVFCHCSEGSTRGSCPETSAVTYLP